MQISVLTNNGLLYVYDISLERRFKLPPNHAQQQRELQSETSEDTPETTENNIGSVKQTKGKKKKAKKESSVKEEATSSKYSNLLKIYEYRANQPVVYDLTSYIGINYTKVNYEHLMVYAHKGDHLILVTDSDGYITIMQPKKKKSSTIIYEFKARLFSGLHQSILSLARHQHNVLFVHSKFIGFVKTQDSTLSTFSC